MFYCIYRLRFEVVASDMFWRLVIFDDLIEHIESRIQRRLPESERTSRSILRLCRVIDSHAGLRESFPRPLQQMLKVMEYGPEKAWEDSGQARELMIMFAAGPLGARADAVAQDLERPDVVLKRALEWAMACIKDCYDVYRSMQNQVFESMMTSQSVRW